MAKYSTRKVIYGNYMDVLHFRKLEGVEKKVFASQCSPVNIIKKEDSPTKKMWLVYELKPVIRGGNAFVQSKIIANISYYYDTKKMYITNGEYLIRTNKEFLDLNWLDTTIINNFNKTIIKNIFLGKLTNTNDVLEAYFKSRRLKNVPINKVIKLLKKPHHYNSILSNINKLTRLLLGSKNVESTLDYLLVDREIPPLIDDLLSEAYLLGEKIDIRWSESRIKDTHALWSKEISKIKLKSMRFEKIIYESNFPIIDGIELLDDNHKVYQEGAEMNHCVYSGSYFNKAKNKEIILLRYDYKGERATIEIGVENYFNKDKGRIEIKQFRGYKNKDVSNYHKEHLKYLLESTELGVFCQKELNVQEEKVFVEEEFLPF